MTVPRATGDPFATFAVARITREDGRYLLYYSWPGDARSPSTDAGAVPAPAAEPWTPEAEPAQPAQPAEPDYGADV